MVVEWGEGWPNGCPTTTSTSPCSVVSTPTCGSRTGSGAAHDTPRHWPSTTATPAVTAAVVRRDDTGIAVAAQRVRVDARAHAELLTPNVLASVAEAGLRMADLDAVVVGCGPGPFTGLHRRWAWPPPPPTVMPLGGAGPPRCIASDAIGVLTTGEVLVATDARRHPELLLLYWARYRDGVRVRVRRVGARPTSPVSAADRVTERPRWYRVQAAQYREPHYPTAAGLGRRGPGD